VEEPEPNGRAIDMNSLHVSGKDVVPEIKVPVTVNGHPVEMMLDTGAERTVIMGTPRKEASSHGPNPIVYLRSVTGTTTSATNETAKVTYGSETKDLTVLVTQQPRVPTMGRDWIRSLKVDVASIVDQQVYKIEPSHLRYPPAASKQDS
jgi:hypothetical protein